MRQVDKHIWQAAAFKEKASDLSQSRNASGRRALHRSHATTIGHVLLAAFFVVAGIMHFVVPNAYIRIVPPALPVPRLLVVLSGIAEILGGAGLLLPSARRAAAWGLAVLLVAVYPANIYAVVSHVQFPGILGQSWVQWLRLPLQIPLILWTMHFARRIERGTGLDRKDRKTSSLSKFL